MRRSVSAAPVQSHFRRAAAIIPYCIRLQIPKDLLDGVVAMPR
jgi:hypothetical protein